VERQIVLKNTETGVALTLPVTPERYPMASGRTVERVDMAQVGQLALPGLKTLFSESLEVMLPARAYPFAAADAVWDPWYYLDQLIAWSQAGTVVRYIVLNTSINSPVLLGEISYEEKDCSNDVYATIPLYEYRYVEDASVETAARPSESGSKTTKAASYTVQSGDTLWAIAKAAYGDGSLYTKLASANGISNPNLIYAGQVLTIPDVESLGAYAASGTTSSVSSSTSTKKATVESRQTQAKIEAREKLGLKTSGITESTV
jgi:LysM repeat protein